MLTAKPAMSTGNFRPAIQPSKNRMKVPDRGRDRNLCDEADREDGHRLGFPDLQIPIPGVNVYWPLTTKCWGGGECVGQRKHSSHPAAPGSNPGSVEIISLYCLVCEQC